MAPLWRLCDDGKLDKVRSALARGKDVNDKDSFGRTALMRAVIRRHNSIVKLLLDQPGIKINEKNNHGATALHYAALANNPEAARMLLLHPTMDSANSTNFLGETAHMGSEGRLYSSKSINGGKGLKNSKINSYFTP